MRARIHIHACVCTYSRCTQHSCSHAQVDYRLNKDKFLECSDAVDEVSSETQAMVQEEEREMTEKEKEIARLRAAEKFMLKDTGNAKCQTCGFVYKWEDGVSGKVPAKTTWDLVPDSFVCPNCKSPKAFFTPEQIEIAGFADNQAYGIGTNTWTEAQKSNAIFGGLAAFFFLFIGGYALN